MGYVLSKGNSSNNLTGHPPYDTFLYLHNVLTGQESLRSRRNRGSVWGERPVRDLSSHST